MAGMTTENHTINSQTDNSSEHIIHTKTVSDCVNAEPKTLDKWIRKQTRGANVFRFRTNRFRVIVCFVNTCFRERFTSLTY